MAITIPGCYQANGTPATCTYAGEIVYPVQPEGNPMPTPAQGTINVAAAIAALTPQAGLL